MEHARQIIAWELLFILVFASLLVIDSSENIGLRSITGYAIAGVTRDTVLEDLETAIPRLSFIRDVDEVSLCLIVNIDSTTTYRYDIVKIGEAIAITTSENDFCKGVSQEDFIISYVSYGKLQEHLESPPSFNEFRRTSDGTNFYILPSRQILSGLSLANPEEFNEKFGALLRNNLGVEEAQQIINPGAQLRGPQSLFSFLFYFIIGIVVLVIVIAVFIFTHQKKPEVAEDLEITAYIKSALSQGYAQEEITESLIASGQTPEKVQQALDAINSAGTETQTSA